MTQFPFIPIIEPSEELEVISEKDEGSSLADMSVDSIDSMNKDDTTLELDLGIPLPDSSRPMSSKNQDRIPLILPGDAISGCPKSHLTDLGKGMSSSSSAVNPNPNENFLSDENSGPTPHVPIPGVHTPPPGPGVGENQ
ncbi:hypothetical protein Dimus_033874, partial [Dionaea muscipula]